MFPAIAQDVQSPLTSCTLKVTQMLVGAAPVSRAYPGRLNSKQISTLGQSGGWDWDVGQSEGLVVKC